MQRKIRNLRIKKISWSKNWQEAEREVEEHIKAGRVKKARSAEEVIRHLKK